MGLAKELILTGRTLNAKRAAEVGLIHEQLAAEGDALGQALRMARYLLAKGPIGLAAAKTALNFGSGLTLEAGLKVERLAYAQTLPTSDRIEGLVAFSEKRRPTYKGQ